MMQSIMMEIRNIITRKITIISLLALIIGSVTFGILAVQQSGHYMKDGRIVSGKEAMLYQQEEIKGMAGEATNEKFNAFLNQLYQTNMQTPLNQDQKINLLSDAQYIKYDGYTDFLLQVYGEQTDSIFDAYAMLYQKPTSNIYVKWQEVLHRKYATSNKTQQKDLDSKIKQIKIPFQMDEKQSIKVIITKFQDVMLLLDIVIIIIFAATFAKDSSTNTNQIIASAKKGRKHVVLARIRSTILLMSVLFVLSTALYSYTIFAQLGIGGFSTSIQMGLLALSPYALNMLQAYACMLALAYISALFICFITLYLSSCTKRSYHVIVILFLFVFFSYMITQNGNMSQGWTYYLAFILPFACFDKTLIFTYHQQMIASMSIGLPLLGVIVQFVLMVIARFLMVSKQR